MNQDEGGLGPSSLKGFYSYKNTFGADSVWLDIPKEGGFLSLRARTILRTVD